jgi:hypothetical protein
MLSFNLRIFVLISTAFSIGSRSSECLAIPTLVPIRALCIRGEHHMHLSLWSRQGRGYGVRVPCPLPSSRMNTRGPPCIRLGPIRGEVCCLNLLLTAMMSRGFTNVCPNREDQGPHHSHTETILDRCFYEHIRSSRSYSLFHQGPRSYQDSHFEARFAHIRTARDFPLFVHGWIWM